MKNLKDNKKIKYFTSLLRPSQSLHSKLFKKSSNNTSSPHKRSYNNPMAESEKQLHAEKMVRN